MKDVGGALPTSSVMTQGCLTVTPPMRMRIPVREIRIAIGLRWDMDIVMVLQIHAVSLETRKSASRLAANGS